MSDTSVDMSTAAPQPSVPGRRPAPPRGFVEFRKQDIEQSIPARFEQQVRRCPDRMAIKSKRHALSYEALNQKANAIARVIHERDESWRGERIALLLSHDVPFIAALLGILKSGNVFVPLDSGSPTGRLTYMLDDSQAAMIVTDDSNFALVQELAGENREVLNVDEIDPSVPGDNLDLTILPRELANITYTSGSTGEPKGVMQTHQGALHAALRRINNLQMTPDDRSPLLFPLSFSAARQVVFAALFSGATLLPFDLKEEGLLELADLLAHEKVTLIDWMPSGLRHLVQSLTGREQFPALRLIVLSAEPISAGEVELYRKHFPPSMTLVNLLSSTETGPTLMYFLHPGVPLGSRSMPAGYPVEDIGILLLDEAGQPVSPGEPGELVIESKYFALGYWRKQELTAAIFAPAPDGSGERIYRTGDVGRQRPDGCLEVVGRKDAMVKIRGYRVEPGEVELALRDLPAIREAAVVAPEDPTGERQLVAYVIPEKLPGPDPRTLRKALASTLPAYMLPAAFIVLEALPLTANGKLDRRALPTPDFSQLQTSRDQVAPRNEIESRLAGIWEELLGVRPIGVHDNFFELGGHSLLAARLFASIEQTCGRHLPLSTLLEGATVEHLATLLQASDQSDLSPLVAIQPAGSRPPFFCVHPLFGDVLQYWPLARYLGPDQPLYGLRALAIGGSKDPSPRYSTIKEMAAHYVEAMQAVQASGPFLIGGFSLGGIVAYEMACQLRDVGHEVALLLVIDSPLPEPNPSGSVPSRDRMERLIRELARKWGLPGRDRELAVAHHRMQRAYQPRRYPGRITFFRAQDRSFSLFGSHSVEFDELWAQLAAGGIEVRTVPGDHLNLLNEPYIQTVAAELKDCLERARATTRVTS
jgi:amino acid adenylation domain-containing protein